MTGKLNKNAYSTIDLGVRRSAQMGISLKVNFQILIGMPAEAGIGV